MALELYMVGLIVRDMPAAVAFYRRLGLAIPAESEDRPHVQIKMSGGLTLFLDARPERWDPALEAQATLAPAAAPGGEGATTFRISTIADPPRGYQGPAPAPRARLSRPGGQRQSG